VGVAPDALPIRDPISDRTIHLVDARTAADALVYTHVLTAQSTEAQARQIRDTTFAAQLVRLGDIGGCSAASAQSLASRLAYAEARLAGLAEELTGCQRELSAQQEVVGRLDAELARAHKSLVGIKGSVSWRMTAPLRAAKRRVRSVKP
jgi:hypothetical protein